MKLRPLWVVLAAGGLLLVVAGLRTLTRPSQASLESPAPAFQLASLGGGLVSLSDYKGQVVLLNFWATWCPSCVTEMPILESLHTRHKARGFTVVAVSVDKEGRKVVAPFVAGLRLTFPVLLASDRTERDYAIYGLPAACLIDARGILRRRYVGEIDPKKVENDILQLLDAKKP